MYDAGAYREECVQADGTYGRTADQCLYNRQAHTRVSVYVFPPVSHAFVVVVTTYTHCHTHAQARARRTASS